MKHNPSQLIDKSQVEIATSITSVAYDFAVVVLSDMLIIGRFLKEMVLELCGMKKGTLSRITMVVSRTCNVITIVNRYSLLLYRW